MPSVVKTDSHLATFTFFAKSLGSGDVFGTNGLPVTISKQVFIPIIYICLPIIDPAKFYINLGSISIPENNQTSKPL